MEMYTSVWRPVGLRGQRAISASGTLNCLINRVSLIYLLSEQWDLKQGPDCELKLDTLASVVSR